MSTVLAVVVLYRMTAEESPAYRSLVALLDELGGALRVMVFDNTPEEQAWPAGFVGVYVRDGSNPGLAVAYTCALKEAQRGGEAWLLLLDQDTTVTGEYLRELLEICGRADVAAICPRLLDGGSVVSPIYPPRWGPAVAVPAGVTGVVQEKVQPFNSGAALRVSTMVAAGGFPEDFPLDYLDHATFERLQRAGGKIYLLGAGLEHALSSKVETRADAAAARRREGILDAERRFYREYGTAGERLLRRVRLLRAVAGRVLRRQEGGQTWRILKAAIRP